MALAIKSFYEFGPFCLDPEQHVLLKDGKRVPITPKVFEILLLLVQNQGRIVSKQEMLNTIWQDSFVEDSNLTFNIRKLRQALGDEKDSPTYIETIPKRGYRFKADVKEVLQESSIAPMPEIRLRSTPLQDEANINSEIFLNAAKDLTCEDAETLSSQATQQQDYSSSLSFLKNNKRLLVVACSCLLIITAGVIFWRYEKTVAKDKNENRLGTSINTKKIYPNINLERLSVSNTSYAALSPDGKYLAYKVKTNGRESLWLRQFETNTSLEIIQPDAVYYYDIAFSHDSQQIYFVRGKDKANTSLYRISILGSAATELIKDNPQGQFEISPDDTQIAFIRYYKVEDHDEYALFISDINGKNERKLISHKQPDWLWSPAWSPDGQNIICVVGYTDTGEPSEQVVKVHVPDGAESLLYKSPWFHIKQIKPLKDGSGLLLIGKPNPNSNPQLYFFDYKSNEFSQITNGSTDYAQFSVTDDAKKIALTQTIGNFNVWITSDNNEAKQIASGLSWIVWTKENKIIFISKMSGSNNVWMMNSDGSDMKQLSFANDNCQEIVVSPDGRYIVFVSNRTGKFHIWRMDADGKNPTQLVDGFGEQSPSISPDGKWVYYNSVDRWNVWKISIEGGNAVKVTDETCTHPKVSPDGKMFDCYQQNNLNKQQLAIYRVEDGKLIKSFDLISDKLSSANLLWTSDSRAADYAASTIGVGNIWRQPLDGSKPQQMTRFKSELIYGFDWSPDGKQLALTRGHWEDNIVLMTGFR